MITDLLLSEIERGRQGFNQGIPFGLPKLESIIDGVTRETYTLIMSNSGSGKTSFALYAYVYRALMAHLNDDNFKCLYFSLEMNQLSLYVKLLSIYIFEHFGIELSFKEILSRKRGYTLSDEHYAIIKECLPWIEKVNQRLEIYDKNVSAKTIYSTIKSRMEKVGVFKETDSRLEYTPYNPNMIYNIVIDHIGLITPQGTNTVKQEIDLASKYLVWFREKCGVSPVVIQQANREQGNIERFKQGKSAFTINDAKDSGNTVNDCNVMLAIYNPNRDGLKTYKGYSVEELGNTFRSIMVLKNRYGDCDVEIGTNFFGQINYFAELKKPGEIYDYGKYKDPSWILNKENEDNTVRVEDKPIIQKSKFVL